MGMVDAVDNLKSSQSVRGRGLPNFLSCVDVKIASSLKKIILNFNLKKRINLTEQMAQTTVPPHHKGRSLARSVKGGHLSMVGLYSNSGHHFAVDHRLDPSTVSGHFSTS